MAWTKEEQIADILALAPKLIDNRKQLQVFISEAKYVDAKGVSEAKKNSSKQLRDTVSRMENALLVIQEGLTAIYGYQD